MLIKQINNLGFILKRAAMTAPLIERATVGTPRSQPL
jgi:hypothetical protein